MPPAVGAVLPMLTVSEPGEPVLIVVAALVAWMLTVSLPAPVLIVVAPESAARVNVIRRWRPELIVVVPVMVFRKSPGRRCCRAEIEGEVCNARVKPMAARGPLICKAGGGKGADCAGC